MLDCAASFISWTVWGLAGVGALLLAAILVGGVVAYLTDWDEVIRDATIELEKEWAEETDRELL